MARTETLRPSADVLTGWPVPLGEHHELLSDQATATRISTGSPGDVDRFDLPPLPGDATGVDTVTVRAWVQSDDGAGQVRARLWNGTDLLTGPTWLAPAIGAWFSWVPALDPSGDPWAVAGANLLNVDLEAVVIGFADIAAGELELRVVIQESTEPIGDPPVLDLPTKPVLELALAPDPLAVELPPLVTYGVDLPTRPVTATDLPPHPIRLDLED